MLISIRVDFVRRRSRPDFRAPASRPAQAFAADAALLAVRRRKHVDLGQWNREQKLCAIF
jgi:hypothetical protein